jgi:hypothetical protein
MSENKMTPDSPVKKAPAKKKKNKQPVVASQESKFRVKIESGNKSLNIPTGVTYLGRGDFTGVRDKKCSKKQSMAFLSLSS